MEHSKEDKFREAILIAEIGLLLGLGLSVTVVLRSPQFRAEAKLIARGVGSLTAGVGLKVGKLEARIVKSAVGVSLRGRGLALDALDATVRDIGKGGKKTIRKLRFLNGAVVAAEVGVAVIQEKERTGDPAQVVAAGAVTLAAGTLTLGLLPQGVSGLVRDPESGTLVFHGSTASFFSKANLTDLVAESIRLLTGLGT